MRKRFAVVFVVVIAVMALSAALAPARVNVKSTVSIDRK